MQMMMGAPGNGGDAAPLKDHGFLLDKGVFTSIDHPDAVAETVATGINNPGQILGQYIDAHGTEHGFLLDDGVSPPSITRTPPRDPGPEPQPSASTTVARLWASTERRTDRTMGSFWTRGVDFGGRASSPPSISPDAGTAPGTGTAAVSINNRGRIVGFYIDAGGMGHGFVREKGVFAPIDHPDAGSGPGTGTLALGLNDRGQIVGA